MDPRGFLRLAARSGAAGAVAALAAVLGGAVALRRRTGRGSAEG